MSLCIQFRLHLAAQRHDGALGGDDYLAYDGSGNEFQDGIDQTRCRLTTLRIPPSTSHILEFQKQMRVSPSLHFELTATVS